MPPSAPKPTFKEHFSPTLEPEVVTAVKEILIDAQNDPTTKIDHGGAGSLHTLMEGLCAKIFYSIENNLPLPRGNTVSTESSFLDRAGKIADPIVRTPRCFGYIEHTDRADSGAIIMEQLPAINLQRLFNGEQKELLEKIDLVHLRENLENFVGDLHALGIVHGDLEARNVMMDLRDPTRYYLIDFGRATNAPTDSKAAKLQLEKELAAIEKLCTPKVAK